MKLIVIPVAALLLAAAALASPPAVGLVGNAKNCAVCHKDSGPWGEGPDLVVDLVDKETNQSLGQPDGSFLVRCRPGGRATFLVVLGTRNAADAPHRNGWLLIDSTTIGTDTFSKFAPGWEVNVPYGCRITGDPVPAGLAGIVSSGTVTVHATAAAQNATLSLQALLTAGEAMKGKAGEGLRQNYHARTVHLQLAE